LNISIINPIEHPDWDELLLTADRATFSHTTAWARVLSESYGYKPLYFAIIDNGKLAGLIPVMEIESFLTGKRGVSLPFTDFCPLVADSMDIFQVLLDAVREHGRKSGWKCIEFREGGDYFGDAPSSAEHYTHTLTLDSDEDKVFAAFKSNTRRNIRRAGAEGVEVKLLNSREAVADFFQLNCITRRDHGLPPQPWNFFQKIFDHIIAARKGFVALVFHQGKPIAGAVFFYFRDEGVYKYGASDKDHQHLRANNLIMWEAMRWCCRNGVRTFSFGRTESENEGLLQFKRGWGAEESRVGYYRLNLRENVFSAERNGTRSSYPIFKMLPMPMLRLAGRILYRHVG
jgi:hypothetical protein